jgi:TPR repeat protein
MTRDAIPPLPVDSETPNAPRTSAVVQEASHELVLMREKLQHEAGYWIEYLSRKDVPEACYLKGMCYITGFMNKEKDPERAIRWFRKAVRGEYPLAFARVADHYAARKDYVKAVTFYKKGSTLNDPYASYMLGKAFLFHELGFIKSIPFAIKYLSRSAELATTACTEGAYLLAQLHGEWHPSVHVGKEHVNHSVALQLLMLAASLNNHDAQRQLGRCYEEGLLSCTKDAFLSIAWYCRAADAGDAHSALKLSAFYASGWMNIFPPDEVYAFLWCAQAVALDDALAMYTFGEYHERGVGLRRFGGRDAADNKTARFWYMKASLHGNEDAKRKLKGTEQKRRSFGLFHNRRKSADASVMDVDKGGDKKKRSKSLVRA